MTEALKNIRDYFTPIQPTIKDGDGQVGYVEAWPDNRLSPYIYCYWQLCTKRPLCKTFTYQVVADGCIDVLWEASDPSQPFVIGFSNAHTEFSLEKSFNYFGIRFLPTAFPLLFGTEASALTNNIEDLRNVLPIVAKELSECVENHRELNGLKVALDQFFLTTLDPTNDSLDSRLHAAIDLILKTNGTILLEKEIDVGISPRQLRRLFKFYIGDTPKSFSRIVRFQSILKAKPSVESLRRNKLFYDFGYYDQAHFTKEFKYLYGLPPITALK